MKKYDVDYFIEKFEVIPDEKWCTGAYKKEDSYCVLGHCGVHNADLLWLSEEAYWLLGLQPVRPIMDRHLNSSFTLVNDGDNPRYQQNTPKARILAFLNDIKENQE